ncbi:unnamed protein product [Anisakis simplex]|uniref:Uncharacterized protein n=1 Tax=Anisakis simplex TaxID=6269 RepID=A0A0M3JC26_ANISI|nr:unnamed protein product [Anisakis simplex]
MRQQHIRTRRRLKMNPEKVSASITCNTLSSSDVRLLPGGLSSRSRLAESQENSLFSQNTRDHRHSPRDYRNESIQPNYRNRLPVQRNFAAKNDQQSESSTREFRDSRNSSQEFGTTASSTNTSMHSDNQPSHELASEQQRAFKNETHTNKMERLEFKSDSIVESGKERTNDFRNASRDRPFSRQSSFKDGILSYRQPFNGKFEYYIVKNNK